MTEGFCTRCGFKIETFKGLGACPRCGTKGIPCLSENQVNVSINVHELRVLCIWAENWALAHADVDEDVVYAIALRLRRQLGEKDTSLTLADELRALRDAGYDVDTNLPAGDRP